MPEGAPALLAGSSLHRHTGNFSGESKTEGCSAFCICLGHQHSFLQGTKRVQFPFISNFWYLVQNWDSPQIPELPGVEQQRGSSDSGGLSRTEPTSGRTDPNPNPSPNPSLNPTRHQTPAAWCTGTGSVLQLQAHWLGCLPHPRPGTCFPLVSVHNTQTKIWLFPPFLFMVPALRTPL